MNASSEKGTAPVIEMRGVNIGALRDTEAIVTADVNWKVAAGDFWAITGLQGAGKSDFLMTTAGLLPVRAGDYRIFGEPMPDFEEHRLTTRLRLGLVFDSGHLLNNLTVAENVALPLRYHRHLSRDEIELAVRGVLEATEVLPWASNTPGRLPHPWRKRAGLARALMLKPDVLLVDSPLGGLDLRHADWWLGFLDQLARGHALLNDRPTTMVVTADAFGPWQGHARQFAVLAQREFRILGDWAAVEHHQVPAAEALWGSRTPEFSREDSA